MFLLTAKALKSFESRRAIYIPLFDCARAAAELHYLGVFWAQARLSALEIREDLLFMKGRAQIVLEALNEGGVIDVDVPAIIQKIDDIIPLVRND